MTRAGDDDSRCALLPTSHRRLGSRPLTVGSARGADAPSAVDLPSDSHELPKSVTSSAEDVRVVGSPRGVGAGGPGAGTSAGTRRWTTSRRPGTRRLHDQPWQLHNQPVHRIGSGPVVGALGNAHSLAPFNVVCANPTDSLRSRIYFYDSNRSNDDTEYLTINASQPSRAGPCSARHRCTRRRNVRRCA